MREKKSTLTLVTRADGRAPAALRPVKFLMDQQIFAEGSVLVSFGQTKVLCAASVEEKAPHHVPPGHGWVTAEYALLPRATHTRSTRERGKVGGRTSEIQRLIGRSLRAITDLEALGPRTIHLDCDVIQADGGTRTAAITGAFVALYQACRRLVEADILTKMPLLDTVAAISVGMVDGEYVLDLDYSEDSRAAVDMNVVMTGSGKFVEVQGTAEGEPFAREDLDHMLDLAAAGIRILTGRQEEVLGEE